MFNSLWPHHCNPPGSSVHGLLQARILEWIFPTKGSNPDILHCRWILYSLSHQGKDSYNWKQLEKVGAKGGESNQDKGEEVTGWGNQEEKMKMVGRKGGWTRVISRQKRHRMIYPRGTKTPGLIKALVTLPLPAFPQDRPVPHIWCWVQYLWMKVLTNHQVCFFIILILVNHTWSLWKAKFKLTISVYQSDHMDHSLV